MSNVEFSEKLSHYQHIPDSIVKYIVSVNNRKSKNSVAVRRLGEINLKNLNDIFKELSEITGIAPEKLIEATDFTVNNAEWERFNSMLSELLAIKYLNDSGFKNIKPLKAQESRKEADFIGSYGEEKVALEVMSVNHFSKKWTKKDIVKYILRRVERDGKTLQLTNTACAYNCSKQLLICAFNLPVGETKDCRTIASNAMEEIYLKFSGNKNLGLVLVVNDIENFETIFAVMYPALLGCN
jgi:hypothetical protein